MTDPVLMLQSKIVVKFTDAHTKQLHVKHIYSTEALQSELFNNCIFKIAYEKAQEESGDGTECVIDLDVLLNDLDALANCINDCSMTWIIARLQDASDSPIVPAYIYDNELQLLNLMLLCEQFNVPVGPGTWNKMLDAPDTPSYEASDASGKKDVCSTSEYIVNNEVKVTERRASWLCNTVRLLAKLMKMALLFIVALIVCAFLLPSA